MDWNEKNRNSNGVKKIKRSRNRQVVEGDERL